jgi:hypothetical protein
MKITARTPGTPGIRIPIIDFPGDPGVLAVQNHIYLKVLWEAEP